MKIEIEDFPQVEKRAIELGCIPPRGMCALPENFHSASSRNELAVRAEAVTVSKLLRINGFSLGDLLPDGERPKTIHNKNFEWAALLYVSASLLSENPHAISVALGVISNYLTDLFQGMPRKKIRLSIVVERKSDKVCKKLNYEGDTAGLATIADAVHRLANE